MEAVWLVQNAANASVFAWSFGFHKRPPRPSINARGTGMCPCRRLEPDSSTSGTQRSPNVLQHQKSSLTRSITFGKRRRVGTEFGQP